MANNIFINPFPTVDNDSDAIKIQVTTDPEPDVESYLVRMEEYLTREFPKCILIPVKSDGQSKQPGWCHKGITDASLWQRWTQRPSDMRECDQGLVMTMRAGLIVIDFDDVDTARAFADRFPTMLETAIQKTTKGFHFIFKRTAKCDLYNLYDGARCISDPERPGHKLPIDIKTVCKTGTGGILSLYPSKGKRWLRPMYEFPPIDIPDDLVEFLGTNLASSNASKTSCVEKELEIVCARAVKRARSAIDVAKVVDLVGILSDKRATDYTTWMQVGWCLYNIDSCTLLGSWLAFSARCPAKYDEAGCRHIWDNEMTVKAPGQGFNIGSLHMWAKHDNPLTYEKYMKMACARKVVKAIGATDHMLAKIAHKVLFDRFVYTGKQWYFVDANGRWTLDEDAMHLGLALSEQVCGIMSTFLSQIQHSGIGFMIDDDNDHGGEDDDEQEAIEKRIKECICKLQNAGSKSSVIREACVYFYNKNFFNLLNSKPNLLAFENGVYDLNTKEFRKLRPEDYVTLSTKLTWSDKKNNALAHRWLAELEKVHPEPTRREYFTKAVARDLYGDSGRQLFHVHSGHNDSAANGKTQLFQVLQCALGDYMRKMPVQMLVTKVRPEANKPDAEMCTWPGIRILYCSEPNHTETLNSGILKDFTGGEIRQCRNLHSPHIIQFKPQFKIYMMTNSAPMVDGADEGIRRRMRKLDYLARFVDDESQVNPAAYVFKSNRTFLDQIEHDSDLALEVLRYFLEHFDKNYAYEMPASVRQDSAAYLDENDPVKKMVNDVIVAEAGAMFSLAQIKTIVQANPTRWGAIAPGTLKVRVSQCIGAECVATRSSVPWNDGTRPSNYWVGFRLVA